MKTYIVIAVICLIWVIRWHLKGLDRMIYDECAKADETGA